jgi:hypothetical protein
MRKLDISICARYTKLSIVFIIMQNDTEKSRIVDINKLILLIFIIIGGLLLGFGFLNQYLKYALGIISIIIFFMGFFTRKIKFYRKEKLVFQLIILLIFPVLYSLFIFRINSIFFLKDSILIIFPVLSAYALTKIIVKLNLQILNILFFSILLSYLVSLIFPGRQSFFIFEKSTLSFTFGFFAVYAFIKKNRLVCFLAFLFCILTDYRISLLAMLLVFLLYALLCSRNRRINTKAKINVIFISLLIGILTYIYLVYSGLLNLVETRFGISTTGRLFLYSFYRDDILNKPFLGHGIGYVVEKAMNIHEKGWLLHSDILKFSIEIGLVGLVINYLLYWLYSLNYRNYNSVKYLIIYIVYTTTMLLTGNVSTYVHYILPCSALVFFEIEKEISKKYEI